MYCKVLFVFVLVVSLRRFEAVKINDDLLQKAVNRVQLLGIRNKHLENKVEALETSNKRQLVTEGPIAFTAIIDQTVVDHVMPAQTIVFGTTITNMGHSYNNITGIFTAPLAGVYLFSSSLLDHTARADGTGTGIHADIVQNGKVLARVFGHAETTNYRDQGANTVFVNVQKGDQVWVRSMDNQDLTLGGEMYSSFSGYMLYQM